MLPRPFLVHLGTSGILADRSRAQELRQNIQRELPRQPARSPAVAVLDLSGAVLTHATLRELLVPLAQRIRGGEYGPLTLIVTTPDQDVADAIGYLSEDLDLSLYVAPSISDLDKAAPAGALTVTEHQTLNLVLALGGTAGVTASHLARHLNLEQTAAGNRLANLARHGLLVRFERPRRDGDLYLDPRAASSGSPVR